MYNIKIPKEIRDYQDKIWGGFTWRQILSLVLAGAVGAPVFLKVREWFGVDCAGWSVIAVGAPIIAFGFWKSEDNITLEKYIAKYIKFNILYPKKRKYETNNLYREISNYCIEEPKRRRVYDVIQNVKKKNKRKK